MEGLESRDCRSRILERESVGWMGFLWPGSSLNFHHSVMELACCWATASTEALRKEVLSSVYMLTPVDASPIELQVQSKDETLKPRFGNQNNVFLSPPTARKHGDCIEWMWSYTF